MVGSSRIKITSLWLLSGFYVIAGANHFINPEFYLPLIPTYLPFPKEINLLSGVAEVLLGVGLLLVTTRKASAYLIVAMLICFIPSHVYFIQVGSCAGELCVDEWVGYFRLLVIHPLLILWAAYHRE